MSVSLEDLSRWMQEEIDAPERPTGFGFSPSERAAPYLPHIQQAEKKYGLPQNLLARVIQQESDFDPGAISKAGAVGIAQIMPDHHPGVDPTDPAQSIDYAAKYLRENADRFGGDWQKALAAYNAGPGAVEKRGMDNLPGETQDYLRRIMGDRKPAQASAAVNLTDLSTWMAHQLEVAGQPEPGYLKVAAKGAARGAEHILGGIGSAIRWLGEVTQYEALARLGDESSNYWHHAVQSGWEAPDPRIFRGSFIENPSLKRAVGIVGEAFPSLAAALGIGFGAGPVAGAGFLGLIEGAPQYEEAREAGKGVAKASAIGSISTAGTALLEFIPLGRLMKGYGGGKIASALQGGFEEGLQEAAQTVFQNLVAKIGYDSTQALFEGIIESIIGGFGTGTIAAPTVAKLNDVLRNHQDHLTEDDIDTAYDMVEQNIQAAADVVRNAPPNDIPVEEDIARHEASMATDPLGDDSVARDIIDKVAASGRTTPVATTEGGQEAEELKAAIPEPISVSKTAESEPQADLSRTGEAQKYELPPKSAGVYGRVKHYADWFRANHDMTKRSNVRRANDLDYFAEFTSMGRVPMRMAKATGKGRTWGDKRMDRVADLHKPVRQALGEFWGMRRMREAYEDDEHIKAVLKRHKAEDKLHQKARSLLTEDEYKKISMTNVLGHYFDPEKKERPTTYGLARRLKVPVEEIKEAIALVNELTDGGVYIADRGVIDGTMFDSDGYNMYRIFQAVVDKRGKAASTQVETQKKRKATYPSFQSGADRMAAIKGLRKAGQTHLGANMQDISNRALGELVRHVDKGGHVLLDNGAFPQFKSGKGALTDEQIGQALTRYKEFVSTTKNPENVTVIAPDVVGDQKATRESLRRHQQELRKLLDQGASVILPVQKGEFAPSKLWTEYVKDLDFTSMQLAEQVIVGIPSNAKALSKEEIADLFTSRFAPERAHILGMGPNNPRFADRISAIPNGVEIESDATGLRSKTDEISAKSVAAKDQRSVEKMETETDTLAEWVWPQITRWATKKLGVDDDTEVLTTLEGTWPDQWVDQATEDFNLEPAENKRLATSQDKLASLRSILAKKFGDSAAPLNKQEKSAARTEAVAATMRVREPEQVYGKDAQADLTRVKELRSQLLASANKQELEALNEEAAKISGAWGYEHGTGISDNFYRWLESEADKRAKARPLTKRDIASAEYSALVRSLTDEQRSALGDLVTETEPKNPASLVHKIRKQLGSMKKAPEGVTVEQGDRPIVKGKIPAAKSPTFEYGVEHIDEYSDEGAIAKAQFHKDAISHLRKLGKALDGTSLDPKRKTGVSASKAGIAVAGDIYGKWKLPNGKTVEVNLSDTTMSNSPATPVTKSGVGMVVNIDKGPNNWLNAKMPLDKLAAKINQLAGIEKETVTIKSVAVNLREGTVDKLPDQEVPKVGSGKKSIKPETVAALTRLRDHLENKGAGWIPSAKNASERVSYRIVPSQAKDGYYSIERIDERKLRQIHTGPWNMEQARAAAMRMARVELETGGKPPHPSSIEKTKEEIAAPVAPPPISFEDYLAKTKEKQTSGIEVTEQIEVEETDQQVTIKKDVSAAMRDVEAKIETYNKLLDCLA